MIYTCSNYASNVNISSISSISSTIQCTNNNNSTVNIKIEHKPKNKRKHKKRQQFKHTLKHQKNKPKLAPTQQIKKICIKLSLRRFMWIRNNLYANWTHLAAYQTIYKLAKIQNLKKLDHKLQILTSNELRDVQSKVNSYGKAGNRKSMIAGIKQEMKELHANYVSISD